MAVRPALVCAVVLTAAIAHADRRPVAVVDLANEPQTRELAEHLRAELDTHPELRALPSPTDAAALLEAPDDPDAVNIGRARDARARAEEALRQFNNRLALDIARDGQADLLYVAPQIAVKPYADLQLIVGVAHANEGRIPDATVAFALVHRLDPSRTLDPARYVPEVLSAFAAAKTPTDAPGTVEVKGTGNVWIDGTEVGRAPGTFAAAAGAHVVWLTGVDRETRGATVVVESGQPTPVEIPDAEASRRMKVQRARQNIVRAPDTTARAQAMRRLADLIGVQDAIVLNVRNNVIVYQTWRAGNVDRSPGLSALYDRPTSADDVLVLLAPRVEPEIEVPEQPPVVVPALRWYERKPVQAGMVLGIAAAIVGGILWATADPGTVMFSWEGAEN